MKDFACQLQPMPINLKERLVIRRLETIGGKLDFEVVVAGSFDTYPEMNSFSKEVTSCRLRVDIAGVAIGAF